MPRGRPPKKPMRLRAELWFLENPYYLTHDGFQHRQGGGSSWLRTEACQRYYDFVCSGLKDSQGNLLYPEETKQFAKRIQDITSLIRKPYGIVREKGNTNRSIGDPPHHVWSEIKKMKADNPEFFKRKREKGRLWYEKFRETDYGQVYLHLANEEKKRKRIERLSTISIDNINGASPLDIAERVVKAPINENSGPSLRQYAESVGGVYIFYTAAQTYDRIKRESTRFLTDGQREISSGKFHNAILMWNPRHLEFENNVCPYEERFDHGFQTISPTDCELLGITYEIIVDEEMSEAHARAIEKACQLALHDLPLGKRLHRVPGCGPGNPSTENDGKRRVVGATKLPIGFFEDNPDIVIVGSAK